MIGTGSIGRMTGLPIVPSWFLPPRKAMIHADPASGGAAMLLAHPYMVERIRLDLDHRAMLRRMFSAELLAAAGVKA